MSKELPQQKIERLPDQATQILKAWIEKEYNKPVVSDVKAKHLAALESQEKDGLENLLIRLKAYTSYWGEKMRDTPEERQYMADLNSVQEILSAKVEELTPPRPPEDILFGLINMANGKRFEEGGSIWAKITLQIPSDLITLKQRYPDLSPQDYAEMLISEDGHLKDLIDNDDVKSEDLPGKVLRMALVKFIEATS